VSIASGYNSSNESRAREVHSKSVSSLNYLGYILSYATRASNHAVLSHPSVYTSGLNAEKPKAHVRSGIRRHYATVAIFAFLLLGLILAWRHFSSFRWDLFLDAFYQLDRRWLVAGAILALCSYAGRALRWKAMMLPEHSRLRGLFAATLIGFSAVVLFGRAGELVRPVIVARNENSTIAAQMAIWFVERLYDLLFMLLLFGIGLSQADSFQLSPTSRLSQALKLGGWLVLLIALTIAAILYGFARHPVACRNRIAGALSYFPGSLAKKVRSTVDAFMAGTRSLANPRSLLVSLALTVIEWGIILGSFWCYFHAHPATRQLSLLRAASYTGFMSIGGVVQLPGVGGGAQIASTLVLTELFHLPLELSIGLSLLIWGGASLIVLPFGIPLALIHHLRFSELRKEVRGEIAL
jgi:uncharacterized membrane protein YbhN (UPF0104 family)